MPKLAKICCDLEAFKITLQFQGGESPLVVYFDTPSRRFYCSLIALLIIEMKKTAKAGFIHIHRHEGTVKLLDRSLSGRHASKDMESMWAKIRMAWRNRLPDLETAALFKVQDRDLVAPYEKGGRYRYQCSEAECDAWANLFSFDERNPWRFKFSIDANAIGLGDVSLAFGNLKDQPAWEAFVKRLQHFPETDEAPIASEAEPIEERPVNAAAETGRKRVRTIVLYLIAIVLASAFAGAVWWLGRPREPVPADRIDLSSAVYPTAEKPSLAVLPFENLTGDPRQEFLSDGIADQLITALSQGPYLYVTARTSSFAFKGKSIGAREIAAKLGVRYLVEGSVQRDGDRLRINVQLIDGPSGNHVTSETFDQDSDDLFQIQDDIAMRLMAFLNVKITGYAAGNLKNSRPSNTRAYERYLKGLYYHLGRRPDDIPAARQALEEAIQIDPNFARAYTWLANVYLDEIELRRTTLRNQTLEKAEQIAKKALAVDPDYPPYGTFSRLCRLKKETDCAVSNARKGVAQSPNDSGQYYMLSLALMQAEQFEEAIRSIETARSLAPHRPVNYLLQLAWSLVGNGQYEEAVPLFKEIIVRSPKTIFSYFSYKGLVAAYELGGRHSDAQSAAQKLLEINPKFSIESEIKLSNSKDGPFLRRIAQSYRDAGLK